VNEIKIEDAIKEIFEKENYVDIEIPISNIDKMIKKILNNKKIVEYNYEDKESSFDIYLTNKTLKLGDGELKIYTYLSFSKLLKYYYINYFFEIDDIYNEIFYDDSLYGNLGEESSKVTIGVLDDLKTELKQLGFKLLEKKEFYMVIKFLPDIKDNFFFAQPTVEAILFYDIYDLLNKKRNLNVNDLD
jgi:hypothetical protein